ncbi:tape measure protein [Lactobacillus delbrueckii]|uniref:tape measure protein n=1 Tax=Lactobacillus delbrueckii TaxID=1584 RepID=UPI001E4C8450|nr:tape measure protein [Lactobacillus delbrueckii subsp. lactis]
MSLNGEISTTIKINDAFSQALGKLSEGLGQSQGAFSKLKGALSGDVFGSQEKQAKGFFGSIAGGAMVGNLMAAGLGQIKNMAGEVVGSLDETSTAWNTFEGNMRFLGQSNKQIANTEFQLQNYAAKTIYSASDMASTYAQMKAVGVKNTTALVKGFGGLAAAADNPAQAMKSLSQQATQMAAKPKVQWEDFKIMLEQSPAGMSAVAKAMGMSTKELVSNVKDGKIKTQQFFDAMTKAGNNKYFTGMATQFKTMGDAMDGLMDTLSYNLRKPWAAISKFGINAINGLSDALGSIDYSKLASGITSALAKAQTFISNFVSTAKTDLGKMFDGFKDSGALKAVSNAFDTIKTSISKFGKASSKAAGGSDFFTQLGQFSGKAVVEIANAVSAVATAIGNIKPETLQNLAAAFVALKFGVKGIALTVAVKALQKLADIPADTLNNLINAITGLAVAFALFKGLMGVAKTISAIKGAFSGFTLPGSDEAGAGSAIAANAKAYMQLGVALMLVGAAVLLTATGFYILATACTNLASAGGGAIALFAILLVVIIGLGVALAVFAPAIAASAAGLLLFGVALALIGVSVLLVGAGLLLMSMSLSSIQTYGLGASLAMLALALGITVLGVASIVGAVGLLLLGAAVLVVAIALAALGIGAIVASAGILMLAAAVAMLGVAMLIVSAAITGIVTSMIAMIATVTAAIAVVAASIIAVVASIAVAIIAVVASIGSTIGGLIATLGSTITGTITGIADGIKTVFQGVGDTISQIITSISTGISNVFNSIANVINSVGNSIHNAGLGLQEIAAGLRAIASVGIGKTVALLVSLAGGLSKVASQGSGLSSAGSGMATLAAGAIMAAGAIARLKAVGSNIKIVAPKANFAATVSSVRAGMQAAANAANAGRGSIVSAVRNSIDAAVSAGRSAAASMHSVGVMIGAGLANGMRSELGAVEAAADALVAQADRAARAKAKIHSPSRLFAEIGDFIGQGLAKGIDGTQSLIAHSSEGLIDSAYAAVNASTGEGLGDSLASGFMTAYGAIMQVVEALGGLDGARATIGVKSAQTATMTALPTQSAVTTQVPTNLTQQATNVGVMPIPSPLASLLTPVHQIDYPKPPVYNVDSGSATSSTTNTTAPTSSYVINIQSGAIQVDGAKDPQKSAEQILAEIEEILGRQAAKAL